MVVATGEGGAVVVSGDVVSIAGEGEGEGKVEAMFVCLMKYLMNGTLR